MTRYDAYDPFARIYDRHWGTFATKACPILDHLVLRDLPPGSAVLDLRRGTGQLAAELSRQGYLATGLDGSEAMIDLDRLRNAGFEDVRSSDGNQPIVEDSLHEGRMFFAAGKP